MLTLEDAKSFLRVDFYEDDALIESLLSVTDEYLRSAVGVRYNKDSRRAEMLQRIIVQDLYDGRGLTETASVRTRQLVSDFTLQLRLEMGL